MKKEMRSVQSRTHLFLYAWIFRFSTAAGRYAIVSGLLRLISTCTIFSIASTETNSWML